MDQEQRLDNIVNFFDIDDINLQEVVYDLKNQLNYDNGAGSLINHNSTINSNIVAEPFNDVKQKLQTRLIEKIKTGVKMDTTVGIIIEKPSNELTPEDEKKNQDKKERNKVAAKKSRQKKKESELQLKKDNEILMKKNMQLKDEVQMCKLIVRNFEEALESHDCLLKLNIIPRQDNGDVFCQEDVGWSNEDDININNILDLRELSLERESSLGHHQQKPQEIASIMSFLFDDQQGSQQEDCMSAKETQAAMQEYPALYKIQYVQQDGKLQENCISTKETEAAMQEYQYVHQVASSLNLQNKSTLNYNNVVAQKNETIYSENNSLVYPCNSARSSNNMNAWSTAISYRDDEQSDEKELTDFFAASYKPPPEKKIRLE